MDHRHYSNDVALRTLRYSYRFSTNLFTHSVNSTNITVHILQCVTVMNLNTLQHFPPGSTSTPLSHTRLHLTNRLVLQNGRPCIDALTYLYVYFLSAIYILVSGGGNRVWFTCNSLLSYKGSHVRTLTLRLLMLYIYMEHPFLMFLDHTQRRSTVGRTPLDE